MTLSTHNRDNAQRFARLVSGLPEVMEAYSLTGEMDYILKVAVADPERLAAVVNDVLLAHEAVAHVRSSIALEALKEAGDLPIAC